MQPSRFIPFILLFKVIMLVPMPGRAQEYLYKNYNAKDGLTNYPVYHTLQDKDGFMWFATAAGVARFDGKNFKRYPNPDGVPGLISRMFEDSRGRIWLMRPYKNVIGYYYKEKIYTQQNDSLLKKIQPDSYIHIIAENKNHELLLTDSKTIYHIDSTNRLSVIKQNLSEKGAITHLSARERGDFLVCFGKQLFSTDTKTFTHLRDLPEQKSVQHMAINENMACWMDLNTLHVNSSYYRKSYKQFIGSVNTLYLLNDSMLCLNTTRGTVLYNLLQQKIEKQFLTGSNVAHFLIDKEDGYWFATSNEGVFRLSSPIFKSITPRNTAGQKLGVYALTKLNNEIWGACDMGYLVKISDDASKPIPLTIGKDELGNHRVFAMAAKQKILAAVCGDYVFLKDQNDQLTYRLGTGSGKDLAWKNNGDLVIASGSCLYTMHMDKAKANTVHWTGKVNCVFYRNDSTWFGTNEGLYLMKPDATIIHLGNNDSLLRAQVSSIREAPDGTIWLATYSKGVLGLKNNNVAWHFGTHNYLNSDKIHCIGVDSGYIWAGTDHDMNKIPIKSNGQITRYSYSDILNSAFYTILVENNLVYGGSQEGVTWFDKRDTLSPSICNLKLLSVNINEKEKELEQVYFLPYRNNSIRFDYTAISMKSDGSIVYHYRLSGLDTTWKTTKQNTLELISLPPGEYKLELFAINKFNVKSRPFTVDIVVENPFWKNNWFIISAILLTSLITWFVGRHRNNTIIRKEELRRQAEQQLADLEQKALRAQMNPHFIFNCLHSIQSFILDQDTENANKYLSRFASLIRQTLENSLHSFMPLADEIQYLSTYLQLEQMRSESTFEYYIETDPGLSPTEVSVPVMILQPFVENAVRHGVRSVNGKAAVININFARNQQEIVCRIQDNGIGRQQSRLKKNAEPIAYRSRGMQLTYERIELINTNSVKKILVEVTDKFNDDQEPAGTDVIIRFPIFSANEFILS